MSLLRVHRVKLVALILVLASIGFVGAARVGATPTCSAGQCAGGPGHPNECIPQYTCHQGVSGGYMQCRNGGWQYYGFTCPPNVWPPPPPGMCSENIPPNCQGFI